MKATQGAMLCLFASIALGGGKDNVYPIPHSSGPLVDILPQTSTKFTLPKTATRDVIYNLVNRTKKNRGFDLVQIPGVTQVTRGGGECPLKIYLQSGHSCKLHLRIIGNEIAATGINGGPILRVYFSSVNKLFSKQATPYWGASEPTPENSLTVISSDSSLPNCTGSGLANCSGYGFDESTCNNYFIGTGSSAIQCKWNGSYCSDGGGSCYASPTPTCIGYNAGNDCGQFTDEDTCGSINTPLNYDSAYNIQCAWQSGGNPPVCSNGGAYCSP